jgi:hypothetical protein
MERVEALSLDDFLNRESGSYSVLVTYLRMCLHYNEERFSGNLRGGLHMLGQKSLTV